MMHLAQYFFIKFTLTLELTALCFFVEAPLLASLFNKCDMVRCREAQYWNLHN